MNPLHLIWIIPLSASIGFMAAAFMAAAKEQSNSPTSRGGATPEENN